MDKDRRKTVYDPFRVLAVKFTAKEFQVTETYVRNSINGTASGGRVEEIRRIYREKYQEFRNAFVK